MFSEAMFGEEAFSYLKYSFLNVWKVQCKSISDYEIDSANPSTWQDQIPVNTTWNKKDKTKSKTRRCTNGT